MTIDENSFAEDLDASTGSDAYIRRRLEHRLGKNSLGFSVFRELPEKQKQFFLSQIALEPGELPVYGFYNNKKAWIFGTTRKLSWSRTGFSTTLRYNEVTQVSSPELNERLSGPVYYTEDDFVLDEHGRPSTIYLSQLSIKDIHGKTNALLCDSRRFSAIWGVINFSLNLIRIHRAGEWIL